MNMLRVWTAGWACLLGLWSPLAAPSATDRTIDPSQAGEAAVTCGTTYYVDEGDAAADDGNSGTAAMPWRTISRAADAVDTGDTVIVKAGTYTEQVTIRAPHAGRPGKLITFRANPGGAVVIDGEKKRASAFQVNASYIRIDGFEIKHTVGHGILVGWDVTTGQQILNNNIHDCGGNPDTAAVYFTGTHGLIQGNHLHHNAGDGITFAGRSISDVTIRNNVIDHNEVDGMKGGGRGLILIENNVINNMTSGKNHGDGMQLMGMTGTCVVRNNTVWDCTQCIYCDDYSDPPGGNPWGDVYIYNNVVYNTDPGPKGIGGFNNGIVTGTRFNSASSITICNNTLVGLNDASGGIAVGVVGTIPYKIGSVRVLNNLFYNSINQTQVTGLRAQGGTVEMDYNVYHNRYRTWYLERWVDLDKFRATHRDDEQHGLYASDIRFVKENQPDPDYHLAAGSAGIGRGTPIPAVGEIRFDLDKDGNPRPEDGLWDVGAYQHISPAGVSGP